MCVGGKSHYTPESQHRRFEAHAKFEAYSCLLALMTWKARIRYLRKALVLWGDAEGILRGVMANKAWEPVVNEIVAELRLARAPMGLELEANHWWSEENTLADELSRRGSGEQPQSELLKKAKRATMPIVHWVLLGRVDHEFAWAFKTKRWPNRSMSTSQSPMEHVTDREKHSWSMCSSDLGWRMLTGVAQHIV